MAYSTVDKRRRLFIIWIIAVATCALTVAADLLLQPSQARLAGLRVSAGLTAAMYLSLVAMCIATFGWFRTTPRAMRQITVRELRERGR